MFIPFIWRVSMKKSAFVWVASLVTGAMIIREIAVRQAFGMMVERKNSRLGKKLCGDKDDNKRPYYEYWLDSVNMRTVSIVSHDGLKLFGHYITIPDAKRNVLMMHGWRGVWKDCVGLARELVKEKCNVLIIEERAQGNSEGRFMGFGVKESVDCRTWYRFLHRENPLPIYLMGESMGAATVMMAAGRGLPSYIKGIIADCGFTTPYEIVRKVVLGREGGTEGLVNLLERRCVKKAGYSLKGASATESMKKCPVPVFFAHGTADSFVPHRMSITNYRASASRKTLYLVDGAEHCGCFEKNPEEYVYRLKKFFGWDNKERG